MKTVLIVVVCVLWLFRVQRLLQRSSVSRAKRFMRLWVENAVAVAVMIPLAAGPSPRPLLIAVVSALAIGAGFGLIVTVVLYLWGGERGTVRHSDEWSVRPRHLGGNVPSRTDGRLEANASIGTSACRRRWLPDALELIGGT